MQNPKEWFVLYKIALNSEGINADLSNAELAEILGFSVQTVSRRLRQLEESMYIEKVKGMIKITDSGFNALHEVYDGLRFVFGKLKNISFCGTVQDGMGEGGYYIGKEKYLNELKKILEGEPFLGTLNVRLSDAVIHSFDIQKKFKMIKSRVIKGFEEDGRTFGDVGTIFGKIWSDNRTKEPIKCIILDVIRTSHGPEVVEIVAKENIRDFFDVGAGDDVCFEISY